MRTILVTPEQLDACALRMDEENQAYSRNADALFNEVDALGSACLKSIKIEMAENEEDAVISDMMQNFSAKINQPVPEPVLISQKNHLLIQGDKKEAVFLSLLIQSALYRKDTVLITDLQFMQQCIV